MLNHLLAKQKLQTIFKPKLYCLKFEHSSSVCFDFKLIPGMIFRKIGCLVVTSNLVKLKSISNWLKIRAKKRENHFRFHFHFKWFPALENRRERERERARRSSMSEQEDRIGARRLHRSDRSNPPSSNPVTDHWDRLAIFEPHAKRETERVERLSHREPTRTNESHHEPVINSFSFLFEIFVIKFVCDFDFLLSLFDLWFCCCCCGGVGGGVFGGFPVVWWWVLWVWWWKIAFSECYQSHEIIF